MCYAIWDGMSPKVSLSQPSATMVVFAFPITGRETQSVHTYSYYQEHEMMAMEMLLLYDR